VYTGHAELAVSQLVSPQTSTPSGQVVPPVGQSSVQSLEPPQQSAQGTCRAQVMWQLELASQLIAQLGARSPTCVEWPGSVPQLSVQEEPFVHASRHGTGASAPSQFRWQVDASQPTRPPRPLTEQSEPPVQ